MAQGRKPKWLKEVEEILRKQYREPDLSRKIGQATELIKLVRDVEIPSGETGKVMASMLRRVSEDLRPLAAVYAGFQLGVAWERYQNASQSQGK